MAGDDDVQSAEAINGGLNYLLSPIHRGHRLVAGNSSASRAGDLRHHLVGRRGIEAGAVKITPGSTPLPWAPSAAISRATPLPMPRPAPVTMAIFPFTRSAMVVAPSTFSSALPCWNVASRLCRIYAVANPAPVLSAWRLGRRGNCDVLGKVSRRQGRQGLQWPSTFMVDGTQGPG